MAGLASSETPMDNLPQSLPEQADRFIAERLDRGDVVAVLLYGSYARGTQHEQSDVELGQLLADFYLQPVDLESKFDMAERLVDLAYEVSE